MTLDDTKIEVLAEHYSDTFSFIQSGLKRRDRLFAGILLVLFIMLFQLYAPAESSQLISNFVATKLATGEPINFNYVQSAIWFVLLAAAIKYFQAVILVERQYDYIHMLEATINAEYGGHVFTREGAAYLKDYPAFLIWASFLYTILFPAILALVSTTKIFYEFNNAEAGNRLVWFDGLMFVFLAVSTGLYLAVIHSKSKDNDEREETESQTS